MHAGWNPKQSQSCSHVKEKLGRIVARGEGGYGGEGGEGAGIPPFTMLRTRDARPHLAPQSHRGDKKVKRRSAVWVPIAIRCHTCSARTIRLCGPLWATLRVGVTASRSHSRWLCHG